MSTEFQYDPHQFYDPHNRAVSAESRISYSDYEFMHTQRRKPYIKRRTNKYEWALNDSTLRNVVLTFLERRYYITSLVPAGASDADRVARIEAQAKFQMKAREVHLNDRFEAYEQAKKDGAPAKRLLELQIEFQNADSRIMFDRRPVELLNAVVYLSYRLGYDSTTVAEQLKMLPPAVRILLYRLNYVADDIQSGHVYHHGGKKGQSRLPFTRQELVQLWFLRNSGLSWAQVARKLGRDVSGGHGMRSGSNLIAVYNRYFVDGAKFKEPRWKKEPRKERPAKKPPSRPRRRWTVEKLEKLWDLRASGKIWREIGEAFGCTAPNVHYAAHHYFERDPLRKAA
jgi:hypothetical protein